MNSMEEQSHEAGTRRPWTDEEDTALITAIQRYGAKRGPGSAWSDISAMVGKGRTNKDCRKRWFHSLDPSVRKGKWSTKEDLTLRRLYDELGPQWKEIALRIPGRKDDQVSKRWRDVLDPTLTPTEPWDPLEDALLLQMIQAHGAKWTTIAEHLPGRSPLACRNRSRRYLVVSTTEKASVNQTCSPLSDNSTESGKDPFAEWIFPQLTSDPLLQRTDFNFDTMSGEETQSELGQSVENHASSSNPQELPSFDFMSQHFDPLDTIVGSSLVDPGQTVQDLNSVNLSTIVDTTSQAPVANVWALALALESGRSSINVDSRLLRKLMVDASNAVS